MAINALDHVNIRASRMEPTVGFYRDILGMEVTPVPGQADMSQAAWIVARDGRPVVHINLAIEGPDFLGEDVRWADLHGSARVHHVAFDCGDYDEILGRINRAGLAARFNEVPQINLRQIFVNDPDGILIELNFR